MIMATVHVTEGDDFPTRVRELLDLADKPADVFVVPGTRDIEVPEELAGRFLDSQAADPEPARKRAPRKPTTAKTGE
jgi:hypothetical protein